MRKCIYFLGGCILLIVFASANRAETFNFLLLEGVALDEHYTDFHFSDNGYSQKWPEEVLQKVQENKLYASLLLGKYVGSDSDKCILCNLLVGALLAEKSLGMTNVQISSEAEYFCEILGLTNISDRVCEGVIGPHVDVLSYIVGNVNVTSANICAMLLGCESGQAYFEWDIDIPEGETVEKVKSDGSETFKIGHITDIHYDPMYTEGKVLNCKEPLCCQSDQKDAEKGEEACGYWGSSYESDTPLKLVEEALKDLANKDVEYVYFTGDLVSHRVWGTSVEYNSKAITEILQLFKTTLQDIPVFPVLGNHEAHPVNVYAPLNITEDLNTQWLYDLILEEWSSWLSSDDIKETVKKGGYYTTLVKPGFRIVVLNNNVCSFENWWNFYENNDPYGQLKWLVEILEAAEKNEEIVHILYHIQTSSCLGSWGKAFNKILNRFSNTVAAQFNGHTHRDQFFIYYNDDNKPVSVAFNGGSLIPDRGAPNYKVHLVDSTGFDVWDSLSYSFDLKTANEKKSIDWKELYSFRDAFSIENALTPTELDALVFNVLNKNEDLAKLYHKYYFSDGPGEGQAECDRDECQKRLLCEIVTTVHNVNSACDNL